MHGDDYVGTGTPEALRWMQNKLDAKYQVKTQLLGPGKGQCQQLKILNGVVTLHGQRGITYEADPRHVELVIEQLILKDAKTVSTPGTREEGRSKEDHKEALDEKESTRYRAVIARLNNLSPNRPDIAYAVKGLARAMAKPTNGDMQRLKRLGRYLKGKPRLQQWYNWQSTQEKVRTYSGADWAGCRDTRKSMTGGCVIVGTHTIKAWSRTQSLIALSSGESEPYASLKAAAETLRILSMAKDFAWKLRAEVWGDASAALGIINRRGLGKTRHNQTGLLWIQQTAAEQQLKFGKGLGKQNPADFFTKYLDKSTSTTHTKGLGYQFTSGRAEEAPRLHMMSRSWYYNNYEDNDYQQWQWLEYVNGRVKRQTVQHPRARTKNLN